MRYQGMLEFLGGGEGFSRMSVPQDNPSIIEQVEIDPTAKQRMIDELTKGLGL